MMRGTLCPERTTRAPNVVPPLVVASKLKLELSRPAPAARIADLVYQTKGGNLIQITSLRRFADLVKDLVSHVTLLTTNYLHFLLR